jgi:hypothetical protein
MKSEVGNGHGMSPVAVKHNVMLNRIEGCALIRIDNTG